jgi:small subunit ribosomal protein S20
MLSDTLAGMARIPLIRWSGPDIPSEKPNPLSNRGSMKERWMPIIKSAIKRLRQNRSRNLQNKAQKTNLRSTIKRVRAAIASKDKAVAQTTLAGAISVIDRSVGKGLIHKNTASRYKSRLSRQANALQAS